MPEINQNQLLKWAMPILIILVAVQGYFLIDLKNELERIENPQPHQNKQVEQSGSEKSSQPDVLNNPLSDDFFNSPDTPHDWDPYSELQKMHERMERIFGDAFGRFHQNSIFPDDNTLPEISPSLDIREQDDQYIVTANVPGADNSNIEVTLEDKTLNISAKVDTTQEDQKNNYLRKERRVGSFQRSLVFDEPVDASKMETNLENGVLTIIVPKANR